jgi:hypothetical protein
MRDNNLKILKHQSAKRLAKYLFNKIVGIKWSISLIQVGRKV